MKRSTKQLLSLLLTIVMVFGLMAPAMAARPMMGDVAETPAGEAAPAASRSTGVKTKATLMASQTYKLLMNEEEGADATLTTVSGEGETPVLKANDSVPKGKYGTLEFFTIVGADVKETNDARADGTKRGVNLAKAAKGTSYIEFKVTGDNATATVTYRGASTGTAKSAGALFAMTNATTVGDAVTPTSTAPATGDILEMGGDPCGQEVKIAATYTLEKDKTYRIASADKLTDGTTNPGTSVHVVSVVVSEDDGDTYTVCTHANAALDNTTAKAPSCGVKGKAADKVCPDCFKVIEVGADIAALEHDYDATSHLCKNCGETDPASITTLTGGSWKADLESVPGATGTATDNQQYDITEATKVKTEGITAVELWADGTKKDGTTADKWKYKGEAVTVDEDHEFTGWLCGNNNGEYTEADGKVNFAGSKFVFKAKADGTLTVYTKVNSSTESNPKPYFCLDKDGNHLTTNSGKWFTETQAPLKDTVKVKAGDEVVLGFKGGKLMIYGFDFKVSLNESWKADLESVPGATGTATDNQQYDITEATKVKTEGVTAVELWADGTKKDGTTADKWKYKGEAVTVDEDHEFTGWLCGNNNGEYTETDGKVNFAGSKFVFKVKQDGTLTVYTKVNSSTESNPKPYFCLDKDGNHLTTNSGKWFTETQAPLKDTVKVKAGDEVVLGFKGGKLMIYGFDFSSGSLEEVTADWTAAAQGADNATITGTPDNAKGTITVKAVGPKVGVIVDDAEGTMTTYADSMTMDMVGADDKVIASKSSTEASDTHSFTFEPPATGTYTFKASLKRSGETDIPAGTGTVEGFVLPLAKPGVSSIINNGGGSVTVMWSGVAEANSYNLYVKKTADAAWPTEPTATVAAVDGKATYSKEVTGLETVSYDFKVEAVRTGANAGTAMGDPETAVVKAEKVTSWNEVTFGTSATDKSNWVIGGEADKGLTNYQDAGKTGTVNSKDGNYTAVFQNYKGEDVTQEVTGLTGDLNTDPQGRVLLSSRDGAGKIKENEGADGVLFYYTPIPAGMNYTLTADVEVLRWATSNTQNGVGLAAMDRVPATSWTGSASSNSGNYWDNVYMVGAARTGFSYDKKGGGITYSNKDVGYDSYTKYSYYMGLMSIAKYGIPQNYTGNAGPANYYERRFPLDTRIPADGVTAKAEGNTNRFNLIGNYSVKPAGFSMMHENSEFMAKYELTKFKLQIQKNNTGYISTAWDDKGNKLGENIDYFVKGAMDLSGDKPYHDDDQSGRKDMEGIQSCMDSDYEYVGLFTSREMDALFSNVKITTIPAEDDAPAVLPPITKITPTMSISSGNNSNSEDFVLSVSTNVEGTVKVIQNGSTLPDTYEIKYNAKGLVDRLDVPVKLKTGNNSFSVTFTPDPNQELAAFTELANTSPLTRTCQVKFENYFSNMVNLYVSPTGRSANYGTKAKPLDIYTAISVVRPGQHIILMEGVYNLEKTIRIDRGINGCETMEVEVEDVEEKPVLDDDGEPVLDEDGNPKTEIVVTGTHTETVDGRIFMLADVDENGDPVKVVLNGQRKAGSVLVQGSDWWVFKDFEVVGASGTGFQVSGSHNWVENVKCHDNLSTGLQISRLSASDHIPVRPTEDKIDGDLEIKDWGDWPCYNTILNCESFRNYDSGYDGADGFGAKETCGAGNVFDGCAAYWNADDGWDFYAKTAPEQGPLGRTIIRNCVAFENGYEVRKLVDTKNVIPEYEADGYTPVMNLDADGKVILSEAGNGNGFKMGGSHLPGAHKVENSFAFYNKAKGIDSNNGPDIKVEGCTSYNNAQENVGLGSNWEGGYNYVVKSTVSFKDENAPVYVDQTKGEIKQMADSVPSGGTSVIDAASYYKWDGSKSANGSGTEITAASFVSLEFNSADWANGAKRDATGALDLGDFLKLTGVTNAGAQSDKVNAATPVETPDSVINPPVESPNGSTGNNGGGGGISGNGGTLADLTNKADENQGSATGLPFVDVADDAWYHDTVAKAFASGMMKGIDETHFAPSMNTTRAMVVTILYRLDGEKKSGNTTDFTDLTADWYKDAVIWAANTGVVKGMSDTIFAPDLNVTREQLATMLYRYANPTAAEADALDGFVDAASVSDWAAEAVAWCVKSGIITGKGANNLDPQGQATRAEAVTMLVRFADLMSK